MQYELLRYHMSSETHGKSILPEEQQQKIAWSAWTATGLYTFIYLFILNRVHAFLSSLAMHFIY